MLKSVTNIVSEINSRKFHVSSDEFRVAKQRYLSLYRQALMQLYEAGYQSDPTMFSEKEALSALIEEGYRVEGVNGSYEINEPSLRLSLYRDWYARSMAGTLPDYFEGTSLVVNNGVTVTEDKRFWTLYSKGQTYLEKLYLAVYLREQVLSIDKMFNDLGMRKLVSSRKKVGIVTSYVAPVLRDCPKFPITEGTLEVLLKGSEKLIPSRINAGFTRVLLSIIAPEVELPALDDGSERLGEPHNYSEGFTNLHSEYERVPGLFIDGISRAQEDSMITELLGSSYEFKGVYGEQLKVHLNKLKEDNISVEHNLRGLVHESLGELRTVEFNKLNTETVLTVQPDILWELVPTDTRWVTCGAVSLNHEGDVLSMHNICAGHTGQFYSKNETKKAGTAQIPIRLPSNPGVDLYDVEFGVLSGELPKGFTGEFTLTSLMVPFETDGTEDSLEISNFPTLVEGILASIDFCDRGLFGPVWVPQFINKDLSHAIDKAYNEVK